MGWSLCWKEFYGRGPTRTKSYFEGRLGGLRAARWLSRVEQTLLEGGRTATVIQQRMEFQEVMRDRFGGTEAETKTARKRAISSSIKAVSAYLGNTPAVCRASCIDPLVFDRYHPGWTVGAAIDQAGGDADLSKRARTRAHRGGRAGPG